MEREEESHTDHSAGLESTSNALVPHSGVSPETLCFVNQIMGTE